LDLNQTTDEKTLIVASDFRLHPAALDPEAQQTLADAVLAAVTGAPFRRSETPGGRRMSVAMSNLGPRGWVTDAAGYRYQSTDPLTGRPWPPLPAPVAALWRRFTGRDDEADACLVNLYRDGARMGLHQDRDESDLTAPVVSVSLGDTAVFRIGGPGRRDPTRTVRLASGDVCVLDGAARMAFHGVDRVLAGSSRLIPGGGRLNLTLRLAGERAGSAAPP
jgi:alkylated DNA repair protein (DNA oxidative demethylase)